MATFDSVLQPTSPQARAPHLQNNLVIGWIPATIRVIEDENKLGRIEIESELIAPNTILPSWDDGKVLVLEDFTSTNSQGGSHRFLQNGAQVALLPMMGDPTRLLMLGCIHSIVDQPSPELDRSKGLHGSVTPGQVFKVNNDTDASSIDARPTGAVQHVSGQGDITAQTKNGAKQTLHADGTIEQQNPMASSVIAPDGTIQATNFAKGYSLLKPDGTWELKSSSKATLNLHEGVAELKAPLNPISKAIKELSEQLPKAMSIVRETLSKAQQLVQDFQAHGDLDFLMKNLAPLLEQAGQFKPIMEKAIGSLDQLTKTHFDDIAEQLLPQAEQFLNSNLSNVFSIVQKTVEKEPDADGILTSLISQLPTDLQGSLAQIQKNVLDGLSHNKEAQIQYLTQALIPDGGLSSVQGIVGLDLHKVLPDIQGCFDIKQPDWLSGDYLGLPPTPQQQSSWQATLAKTEKQLGGLLPDSLKHLFDDSDLSEIIQLAATGGNPMHVFMGKAGTKLIGNLVPQLSDVAEMGSSIPVIQNFVSGLGGGGDISSLVESLAGHFPGMPKLDSLDINSAINTALPIALTALSGGLGGGLVGALGGANPLFSIFGKSKAGGVLRLTKDSVEAKATESGLGAKLQITAPEAALVGIGGMTKLFADRTSAGIKSPWGSFGLGSSGGEFLSQAQMAFRVFQSAGKSAGFLLHPNQGASLASFEDSDFTQGDTRTWKRKSAEITVDEGVVIIRSHRSTDEHQGITVTPQGTFIEGIQIRQYLYALSDRIAACEEIALNLSENALTLG